MTTSLPGAPAAPCRHRSRSMEPGSQRSASPSSRLSNESAGSKRPSCTGCSMMSQSATAAHRRVVAQAARRRRCRCWPGSALSVSLRTTRSGSRTSTNMSLQPSNHTATNMTARRAAKIHRCQVFRCGKQITSEMAAAASSARHVTNSPVSGGSAASPTFGGDRPQAATAITYAIAESKYTAFCHTYAWPGVSASARMTQSCGPSAAASCAAATAAAG
mmetsp:Transcript_93112/g.252587  ORF Transcript_93112/g.252587 Transcript_93112/m.252587 type:complete len:218 (+) Transcript_93112:689-1342(+)